MDLFGDVCAIPSALSFVENYAIDNGYNLDDLISLGLISSKNKNDIYNKIVNELISRGIIKCRNLLFSMIRMTKLPKP